MLYSWEGSRGSSTPFGCPLSRTAPICQFNLQWMRQLCVQNSQHCGRDRLEGALVSLETTRTAVDLSQNATVSKSLVAASSERKSRGSGRTAVDRISAHWHGFRTGIHFVAAASTSDADEVAYVDLHYKTSYTEFTIYLSRVALLALLRIV